MKVHNKTVIDWLLGQHQLSMLSLRLHQYVYLAVDFFLKSVIHLFKKLSTLDDLLI